MKITNKTITPLTGLRNTWEKSSVCKHFFPCNSLDSNNNLIDVKGGVIIQPQAGKQFILNSSESSIIPNCDGTIANLPVALVSGSWSTLATGKAALLMCAGYIDSTYTANKTIRCSIGDLNQDLGLPSFQGFGMSDGTVSIQQHCVFGGNVYDSAGTSFNGCQSTSGNSTGNVLAQNTYIIRYVLYQPGTQLTSKILDFSGATQINNATLYGDTNDQLGATYVNAFRMHGFRCTGIALYHFDTATAPTDYLTMVNYNGSLWKTGIREIYPISGW